MKREDYKNYTWYPVNDETYWAEDFPEEFPGCVTIVRCTRPEIDSIIRTRETAFMAWATMAKYDEWVFMIIEVPQSGERKD